MQDHVTSRRVVILGGGIAGLFAARALRRSPVAVTVVDRRAHHLFQPLLYQCASGILSEGQIAQPLRGVLRRHHDVSCLLAEATDVDVKTRLVHARRPDGGAVELPYEDLIVAVGMHQSYFGHDEFAAHAPGMKTLDDALDIRRRTYRAFEMAETAADDRERQQWLTFALVGGGPTGVELAGQVREIAGHTLDREFQRIDSATARVLLFEGSHEVLGAFGHPLAHRAARTLRNLGVELHLGTMVTDIDERGLPVAAEPVAGTEYDLRTPRAVGALRLDTPFGDLDRGADGRAVVRLAHPSGAFGTDVWLGEGADYVQLYTGDTLPPGERRRAVAIEPMTCPPDAFRSGTGLVGLGPGEQHTVRWGITPWGGVTTPSRRPTFTRHSAEVWPGRPRGRPARAPTRPTTPHRKDRM
ncbi:aldose epimerase family protein [Streptomyces sp. NPDC055186]